MSPVRILGAGVSGLSAAISLRKADRPVEVFERTAQSGSRFRGDLEGLENWSTRSDALEELRHMNIATTFPCHPRTSFILTDGEEEQCISSSVPLFYLVRRGVSKDTLDQALLDQAVGLGATIHFSKTIPVSEADIVATGPVPGRFTGMAKGVTFTTDADDIAVALVGERTSYRGYSYLLIADGYGCINSVCFCNVSNVAAYFDQAYAWLVRRFDLRPRDIRKCGGVGSAFLAPRLRRGASLVVGEAAGLQDQLWGFGLRFALTSGHLAARSILERRSYARLLKKRLVEPQKASVVHRYYVDKYDPNGTILLRMARNAPAGTHRELLRESHNLTVQKRLAYPLACQYLRHRYPDTFKISD